MPSCNTLLPAACSLIQDYLPLMSSPSHPALQQLHHINSSSPNFRDLLSNILYGEEYRQCVPNIAEEDLVWLVDYLDKVYHRITLPRSLLKST